MSAWDVGPFDNDAALDLLRHGSGAAGAADGPGEAVNRLLAELAGRDPDDVLDADEASAAVAAAALVSAAWSGLSTGDVVADDWLARHVLPVSDERRDLALAALDRAAGSELGALWSESDALAEWTVTLGRIRLGLNQPLSERRAPTGRPTPPLVSALRVGDVVELAVAGEPWALQVRSTSSVRGDWLRVLGPIHDRSGHRSLADLVASPERFNVCVGDPPIDRLLVGATVTTHLPVPEGHGGPPVTIECAARRRPGAPLHRFFKIFRPTGERYEVEEPNAEELGFDVGYFQTWPEVVQRLADGWTPRQEIEQHLENIRHPPGAAPPFEPP